MNRSMCGLNVSPWKIGKLQSNKIAHDRTFFNSCVSSSIDYMYSICIYSDLYYIIDIFQPVKCVSFSPNEGQNY